ncbi:ATP-binding protein [Herbaspirillum sp. GCM10030257]|uniref:ATP-binding protein n=1 Tax=Herbaspirillum sp. GCM10030257 TaxID=3273393 RepID=UPI0036195493
MLLIYQYQEVRSQQEKDTLHTARALVQAVDSHLLRGQALAQGLSTADSLTNGEFARFHNRAGEAIARFDFGINIVLRDKTGQLILNTSVAYGEPLPRQPYREHVQKVFETGKPAVSNLFMAPQLKRPIVSVDVPVVLDGGVLYSLGVGLEPRHFNAMLKNQNLPSGWIAAILDSSGTIVGRNHTPEQFVGNKATPKLLQAIMNNAEGTLESTTQEGALVLTAYSRSPSTNWGVAIGIPNRALKDTLKQRLFLLVAGVTTLFGIGLVLAWVMGGRIARSVTALTAPAISLGRGDTVRIPQVDIKEALEVASEISRAADLLKERSTTIQAREAELAEAHRLAKLGTWHWNLKTGEIEVSNSIREIYGREVPPFPDQRGTLLTVESWEHVNAALQQVMQSGAGYDLELQVNHGKGHVIWVNAKCEPVRNDQNELAALYGTVQDITENKAHEQALRDSEHQAREAARRAEAERSRLDAVLEATPVGIVVANASGVILQSNAAHRELWGANQPLSKSTEDYVEWKGWWADGSTKHGQRVAPHEWPIARALAGIEAPHDIIEIEPFNTPLFHRIVLMSAAPVRNTEGKIIGGVLAQLDITARVKAEEALRQADRRKDEFLAMLAHELRNPLAPIAAAADLLGLGQLDAGRVNEISTIIARQAQHMTSLVDDLLDVSRVTRGRVALDMQNLDAKQIVADATEQVRPLCDARRHRLTVHVPHEPALVTGDLKRLVQVMTNLLNNAAKFTPEGGEIDLSVEIEGGEVIMSVADNGIGMDPGLVRHAFELFAQGERTPDRSQGGLGIGLALVKSLVELHAGTITAYSEGLGKGSRFTVRIPRMQEQTDLSKRGQPSEEKPAPAKTLNVMVVDDNTDAAKMLAMFIEALGHNVFVEHSSVKALEQARVKVPDVFLLDIGLPEMDGNELAGHLRAQPETSRAVLVAVTGYGQEQDRDNALAAGFDHHFVKPVATAKLAALLIQLANS